MPIFEYRCKKCNRIFESLVFSSRDTKGICCPDCGSGEVEKMLSSFSCGSSNAATNSANKTSGCASSRFT